MKSQVYIAGALTSVADLSQARRIYKQLGKYFERKGWIAYIPHEHSDPCLNPELTARQVVSKNEMQIALSRMVVAEVSDPSLGVGTEVDFAQGMGIPVILLHRNPKQPLSRMLKGRDNICRTILYDPDNLQALYREIDTALAAINNPLFLLFQCGAGLERTLGMARSIIVRSILIVVEYAIAVSKKEKRFQHAAGI